ncbi:hypothetical protein BpHYR1_024278 [Brachionus plicatilis]|uniref:Uncharacterized protein n=1 Tax=Brachionus plicatilis TaxID=10195 RepID=A0A3M7SF73_BRAPC|nr:hypothetical protein BpHYR1_024278 [Brachionus plicatilis]
MLLIHWILKKRSANNCLFNFINLSSQYPNKKLLTGDICDLKKFLEYHDCIIHKNIFMLIICLFKKNWNK